MAESYPSRKPFCVSIIGGGLGGVLLALGLSVRGISVRIYESTPAFNETSAGLGFGPNAVRAMEKLDHRVYNAYTALKTENGSPNKRNTWFDFRLGKEDVPELLGDMQMGSVGGGNVLRASFLMAIVKLLPQGSAFFSKTLTGIEEIGERLKLCFAGGTAETADVVVGCDGIRSVVRKKLLGEHHEASKPVFSEMYLYRGVVDMRSAIAAVGKDLALDSQTYMGKNGDLVTYPIENGTKLNVVAFQKSKSDIWAHERWVIDSSEEEMMRDFEGWGESVMKILRLLKARQTWAIFDMPPAPFYSSGHVTLLGDAAHASTSHSGAGAGMGVEDAFILSELLSDSAIMSLSDVPAALTAYDIVRRPRTQKLVQYSRESGMFYQMRLPGVGNDIAKLRAEMKTRQRWIWDIALDDHLKEARRELHKALNRDQEVISELKE